MNYNLKTFDTIKWLRNRYKSRVKDQYILYESELKEQNMMKAVFNSIDRDKSKFLDRSELYDMFVKYGINITKSKLKEFFKSIDEDEDGNSQQSILFRQIKLDRFQASPPKSRSFKHVCSINEENKRRLLSKSN